MAIFIQHFVRIPLYESLNPSSCLLKRVFKDTRILNNVFLVSMDVTSLYTPGDTQKRFLRGGSAPSSNPLALYNILDRKGIPFEYLLLKNDTPFVYLASFSRLFPNHKMICKAFWAFTQTEMTDFPILLHTLLWVAKEQGKLRYSKIPTLSYT